MKAVNKTPYVMERTVFIDKKGAEHLIVALKATYSISEKGDLTLAEEQSPIQEGEVFWGEPDSSSIKYEDEIGPMKLSTDVFLRGNAFAPNTGSHTMLVSFRVGSLSKTAIVFGERFWKKNFGMAKISDPKPFESIPLIYENAYGGQDMSAQDSKYHNQESRNPEKNRKKISHTKCGLI